jgi:superfamily II DNA or RNA helicase
MKRTVKEVLLKCNSWQDFVSELAPLQKKQKGDYFEILTKLFLKLHPTYATKLSHVWLLKEVPAEIKKYLNLPDPDEGIDLVAETKDKKYWAIQCKYISDENKSLTRNIINSFTDLAFSICHNISFALVCTPAIRYSHKLSMYGERLGFCSGDTWMELDSEFFQQVHGFIKSKRLPIDAAKPREHQKEAIKEADLFFKDDENVRGKLIMPCGTGKSLVSYWIAERLKAKNILVAVPSLHLIRQSLKVWTRESVANKRDINWICVCSDETVSESEKDEVFSLTQDLGIEVNTNPREIAGWLSENKKRHTVVFSTYQSGMTISDAAKRAGVTFDLGIMDEAHKTVGKIDSLFNFLLHDDNISIKKRIFMTATERRYLGQSEHIASMDDLERYGETFYLLPFKGALESVPPILSDYKIVTMVVDKSEITDLIKKNILVRPDRGTWDEEVEIEMLASAVALRKAMTKYPIKHAVSFHKSISRAKAFKKIQDNLSDAFPAYGELVTYHVSGKTPTGTRMREIESFTKAERSLITNARCLTEGVDVPNIDCVLFADPRKSTVDIVQAVGRALRPATGKQFGYVVVPVIIDKATTEIGSPTDTAFASILTVLRALAANDDRIIEHFRSVSTGKKDTGGVINIDIDMPVGEYLDVEKFVNSIELNFWSRLAKLAWRSFEEARAFVRNLGLKGQAEWKSFCNGELKAKGMLPDDIPTHPDNTYKTMGWLNYGDWLGTGVIATRLREFLPFEEARDFARSLGLKSGTEWEKFCKSQMKEKGILPKDIPVAPNQVYKDEGWSNWGDWLGTGTIATYLIEYRPFEEARKFVHNLGLKSNKEWQKFCKGQMKKKGALPEDIPAYPNQTYANKGWKGVGDWLGTGVIAPKFREYRPFEEAREFAHQLGLKNVNEWLKFCNGQLKEKGTLPEDIPASPENTYKMMGWKGVGDWLGTGTIAPHLREYRPFEEARKFACSLGLKSYKEWQRFCKGQLIEKGTLPEDIPVAPNHVYKYKGWLSWGGWLGTGTIASSLRQYRSFEEARKFVHGLGLKSQKEWILFCKGKIKEKVTLPEDIPANPNQTYEGNGWNGMGDWLGTGRIASQFRQYRSFEEAHVFAQRLGLKNDAEWYKFCKGLMKEKGMLPEDIPTYPRHIYKGNGWKGMRDWLGSSEKA